MELLSNIQYSSTMTLNSMETYQIESDNDEQE